MEQAGTRTTLAAPLNPGDTTVTLTSSANWNNAAGSSSHLRTVIVWNYVDGQGYAWPAGTYSRNSRLNSYNDGAISGNVITLSTPWDLPAAPAGTAISNGSSGASYMYGALYVLGPSTWTNYAYKYSGIHSNNAVSATTSFPIATAYIKAGFLRNYPTSPANPTSIQKFANVALVDITESDNKLPLAGGTMTGTLVAPSYDVSGAKILSGTGFPEGVVTAPTGSIYIDKAITNGASSWIKKSGTGNTGWQVLEGDTGWRRNNPANSWFLNGATPNADGDPGTRFRRYGNVVHFILGLTTPSGWTNGTDFLAVPNGFRHPNTLGYMPGGYSTASSMAVVSTGTTMRFYSGVISSARFQWTWITNDPWPTTLPGIAA